MGILLLIYQILTPVAIHTVNEPFCISDIRWSLHDLTSSLEFIPARFILFALIYLYAALGNIAWVGARLGGLKAAVLGVVLNLAAWFGMHVLFSPNMGVNWFAAIVGLGSFIAILKSLLVIFQG